MNKSNLDQDFFSKSKDYNPDPFDLREEEPNMCIKCGVDNCKHHCKDSCYCSLNKIKIDSEKSQPKHCESVDCRSFEENTNLINEKEKPSKKKNHSFIDTIKDSFLS